MAVRLCAMGADGEHHLGLDAVGVGEHTPQDHFYVFISYMVGNWGVIYAIKLVMEMSLKWRAS
jgi:hypothetical protein